MIEEARMLYASADEIQTYQLARLKETLQRAKQAPYFAQRLANCKIESLDDLAKLPITSKHDLQEASPFGSVAVPHRDLYQYHESFGTTGTPVASWLTKNDFYQYARQINQCDLNFCPDDVVVNKFPYAISVPAHIVKLAAQEHGACVVSASSLNYVCPYIRTLDLMKKLKATVLTCLPTEATLLGATCKAMMDMGMDPNMDPKKDFNLRAIGTAGELLTNARRRRIEEFWDCKVYNYYGTTETGNLASESDDGKLHLAWDHFLVEVLDEQTHQPLPMGQVGLPAITTLTREAMPLIRYLLTDRIKLEPADPNGKGRRSPIVHHYGRDQSRFPYQGKTISLADLEEHMFRLPSEVLGDIWMIVVTPKVVYFRVEAERFDPALYAKAEKEAGDMLGFPLKIDAVPPGTIFPTWFLLEPARVGKPAYHCEAETLEQAPGSLPELWMGPGMGGVPGGEAPQ
jgi:phenylacetate-CoA ligase